MIIKVVAKLDRIGSFIVEKIQNLQFSQKLLQQSKYNCTNDSCYFRTLTSTGINNLYFANFMLDNNGNNSIWIKDGEGRVLYDSDGVSEIVEENTLQKVKSVQTKQSISSCRVD